MIFSCLCLAVVLYVAAAHDLLFRVRWREWPSVLVIILAGPAYRRALRGVLGRRRAAHRAVPPAAARVPGPVTPLLPAPPRRPSSSLTSPVPAWVAGARAFPARPAAHAERARKRLVSAPGGLNRAAPASWAGLSGYMDELDRTAGLARSGGLTRDEARARLAGALRVSLPGIEVAGSCEFTVRRRTP